MQFTPVAHFSGFATERIDLTTRMPWLYVVVARPAQIVYIGETFDQGGLVVRLGAHFGPYQTSSLRQCAERIAYVRTLKPPFLVLAARLPYGDDDAPFNGESKQVRLVCEAVLHTYLTSRFVARKPGWTTVSSYETPQISQTPDIEQACESIYRCFVSAYDFLETLLAGSPFHVVLLGFGRAGEEEQPTDVGVMISQIEVSLFSWVIKRLKDEFGQMWWTEGIPEAIRVQCVTRREQEGTSEKTPHEAYLTLIDIRDVLRKNWKLFGATIEKIGDCQGKDRATDWLVELNELRKLWAHPIKQLYSPVDPAHVGKLRRMLSRVDVMIAGRSPASGA